MSYYEDYEEYEPTEEEFEEMDSENRTNTGFEGEKLKIEFDSQINEIKNQINTDIKNAFDESTKSMLSETVLNVLMANDTYKKIEKNISCIADKAEN